MTPNCERGKVNSSSGFPGSENEAYEEERSPIDGSEHRRSPLDDRKVEQPAKLDS